MMKTLSNSSPENLLKNPVTIHHYSWKDDSSPFRKSDGTFWQERSWSIDYKILIIRSGTFQCEINLKNHTLEPGDICVINTEELNQISCRERNWELSLLSFPPAALAFSMTDPFHTELISPLSSGVLGFSALLHPQHALYAKIAEQIEKMEELAGQSDALSLFRQRLMLLELITLFYEGHLFIGREESSRSIDTSKIDRYKKVCSYIEENYASQLSLQDLADLIPCNSQYLCRFFKEVGGISPIQYLIRVRIDKACEKLESTRNSVLEISFEVGFDNVSYFVRKFKELKGTTPKAYRKNIEKLISEGI